MYALFFSPTHISLPGGSTKWTGWKNWGISVGLFKLSGVAAGPPGNDFALVSAFLNILLMPFCISLGAAGGGKFVALAIIANIASSGDLRSPKISSLCAASAALPYLI